MSILIFKSIDMLTTLVQIILFSNNEITNNRILATKIKNDLTSTIQRLFWEIESSLLKKSN